MSQACILHVDDDPNDQFLFEYAYNAAGINIPLKQLASGDEVLAYLEGTERFANRQEHPLPCLLVMDLKMNGISGFDVLQRIRERPEWKATVVILLSSSTMPGDIERAMRQGANAFVSKPGTIDGFRELLQAIQSFWLSFHEFGWTVGCRSAAA